MQEFILLYENVVCTGVYFMGWRVERIAPIFVVHDLPGVKKATFGERGTQNMFVKIKLDHYPIKDNTGNVPSGILKSVTWSSGGTPLYMQ